MSATSATSSRPLPGKPPVASGGSRRWSLMRRWLRSDLAGHAVTLVAAASILLITGALVWQLWAQSALAREKFGWGFLTGRTWDPLFERLGALPFLYGTAVTSAIALLIAVPLGLGAAIFLAELAPPRVSSALAFLIDLLAAVPSVIYGLLGIFVLVPILREVVDPALERTLGFLPLFEGPIYGIG